MPDLVAVRTSHFDDVKYEYHYYKDHIVLYVTRNSEVTVLSTAISKSGRTVTFKPCENARKSYVFRDVFHITRFYNEDDMDGAFSSLDAEGGSVHPHMYLFGILWWAYKYGATQVIIQDVPHFEERNSFDLDARIKEPGKFDRVEYINLIPKWKEHINGKDVACDYFWTQSPEGSKVEWSNGVDPFVSTSH